MCIFRTETFRVALDGTTLQEEVIVLTEQDKAQSAALTLDLKNTAVLDADRYASEEDPAFWNLFLLGLLGGLIALLTPCVFPMIPLTVSFFLKQGSSLRAGMFNAFLYGFFIVLIYVLLSLPFHFLDSLNPEILNTISTNVPLNLLFFAVFVFFAFSFFGYYELTLPSSWGNATDESASRRAALGYFLWPLLGHSFFLLYRAYFGNLIGGVADC